MLIYCVKLDHVLYSISYGSSMYMLDQHIQYMIIIKSFEARSVADSILWVSQVVSSGT